MAHVPNSAEQYEKMIGTPIPQLVSSLAIPTTISMLVTVIYNTADTYFVSQINKSASAAVGMVYTLMAILQAVGYGLGMGAGSLISRKLGEKDDDAAERYAVSAFVAAILAGAVVGWGCLAGLKPILRALKCTDTMLPYAVPYARWILLVAPVSCASFVLNNTLRAEGESTLAMWGLGLGGVLNIVLDPLFIFTLDMGAGGAALATAVSQAVSFVILLLFFLTGRSIVRLRLRIVSRHFCDYWLIFTTGLPTVCRQGLGSVASAVLNMQAVLYGDAAVSAITIANKLYVFVRNLVIGIGQGFQPVAGYNYSAWESAAAHGRRSGSSSSSARCSARSAPSSWPFSRGRSCGGSAATRRSYALVRRRCASPVSFCRCWPSRRSSISSISASATARPRRSWQAAGRAFSSGRAAPAAVAALRRCGDEPARGRPSDLRDLHAVPRSILPAPYPRACRVNSTKKFGAKSPEFFSRGSSIAYIMPDGKPFPRRANNLPMRHQHWLSPIAFAVQYV